MGEKPARTNDAGERDDDDADRSAGQTQAEDPTDGRSDAAGTPSGSVRVAGRTGLSREGTRAGGTGGSRGADEGYVEYERGPDPRELSERYGMDVRTAEAGKLQRLESEFGSERVQRWADEGIPVETMGKPRDMQAFRKRQEARSEEIPTDVERRNEASRRRNEGQNREGPPTGEAGVPDAVRRVVSSPGRSMDESVQREMEAKMGGEFGNVQLHTGPRAAAAAESIDARAFTVGTHVAFNRGEYEPDTDDGKRVLAHELTHVRQQTAGAVSLLPKADAERSDDSVTVDAGVHVQPNLEVSSPDDPAEKEAEEVAQAVTEMDDEGATGTGADSDASPAEGADSADTDHATTGTDDEEVDSDATEADVDSAETETAAESAETEAPDTAGGGAGSENGTGPADDVQRATDAGSAGDHVDDAADVDGAAAADGTSQGTASSSDGTATASPEEATASDSTLAAGGPGGSPNDDGTVSVGRRALRTSEAGAERLDSAIEALYDDGPLQAKLEVSSPDDPAEREAERVADEVMRAEQSGSDDSETSVTPAGSAATRGGGGTVDGRAEAAVRSVTSGGRPLPVPTRTFFENRFGRDFSEVRVHTGPDADTAARSVDAEAFTHGRDIVFASGNYDAGSRSGRKLLAHELTHVVQQDSAAPNRASSIQRRKMSASELRGIGLEPQGVSDDIADFLGFCSDIETVAGLGIDLAEIGGAITQSSRLSVGGAIAAPISLLITGLTQWADSLQAQTQWGVAQGTAYAMVALANGTDPPGPHDQFGEDGKEGWRSAVQRIRSALNAGTEQQVETLRGMYSIRDQNPQTALNRIYHDIVENKMQNYFLGLLPAGGNLYNIAKTALLVWPGPGMVLNVDEQRVKEVLSGEAEEQPD